MIIMIILVNIMIIIIILVTIMINIDHRARLSLMFLKTMMLMLTIAQDHYRCCRRHSHHLDHRSQHHDLLSTGSILSTALDHRQCCFCGPPQDHPIQQNDPQDHHRKLHDQPYQDDANVGNNTKLMLLLTISSWHSGQY